MRARPLRWRKPNGTGSDHGHEDALWIANGIGGKYSITKDSGEFLLWWADDEFTFTQCKTVAEAKTVAEGNWQAAVANVLLPETANA